MPFCICSTELSNFVLRGFCIKTNKQTNKKPQEIKKKKKRGHIYGSYYLFYLSLGIINELEFFFFFTQFVEKIFANSQYWHTMIKLPDFLFHKEIRCFDLPIK